MPNKNNGQAIASDTSNNMLKIEQDYKSRKKKIKRLEKKLGHTFYVSIWLDLLLNFIWIRINI